MQIKPPPRFLNLIMELLWHYNIPKLLLPSIYKLEDEECWFGSYKTTFSIFNLIKYVRLKCRPQSSPITILARTCITEYSEHNQMLSVFMFCLHFTQKLSEIATNKQQQKKNPYDN